MGVMHWQGTATLLLTACFTLGAEPLPQGDDTIVETDDGSVIDPDAPDTAVTPAPQPAPTPQPAPEVTPADTPAEPAATPEVIPAEPTPAPAVSEANDTPPATPSAEDIAEQDAERLRATAESNTPAETPKPAEPQVTAPVPAPRPVVTDGNYFVPEGDDNVISQSGMFSVSGGDSLRMGAIATRADDICNRLCNLLHLDAGHRYTVSIRLIGSASDSPQLNPIRTRIRIIGDQPNFQIRIYPGGGIDLARLDGAIITMVLYERALREMEPGAYPDTVSLPHWLVTGIIQAMQWRSGQVDRELYRKLFARAEMLPPESIIAEENPEGLDAASRQLYDVSCGVLMMSLLSREGGPDQLKTLLAEAATAEGTPKEILGAHFHELGLDKDLLNKWWALQLADLALPRSQEALTPLETERQLSEALTVIYYDPETETPRPIQLDNVYELLQQENWRDLVQPNVERLVALSSYCFPEYRPIIAEYCRVIAELMNGGDADSVQSSLGPLQELRHAYLAAAIRGRDYLDWYEITHLGKENRRSFDTYLEAMRLLRRDSAGPDTALGRYLDDIEALYKQETDAPLPDSLLLHLPARHAPKKK